MSNNFVSYSDANTIVSKIGEKFSSLGGAYVPRGSSTFANLPSTLIQTMTGYVYNVTDDFTTDTRFIEGAGKKYSAGTNVVVADTSTTAYNEVTPVGTENPKDEGWFERSGAAEPYTYTETTDETVDSGKTYYEKVVTPNYQFDVIGNFIDVDALEDAIQNVSDMITGEFDKTADYAVGDVVVNDGKLYKFKTAYAPYTEVTPTGSENPSDEGWYEESGGVYTPTADVTVDSGKTYYAASEWDASKADETTVVELINAAEPESLTTEQINALLALLD